MSSVLQILNTLAPVFLVVLLGAVLRHVGFLTEAFATALNRFIFWVSLPVFLFRSIAGATFAVSSLPAAAVMMLATLVIAATAWFGAPLFGISARSRGTFCQSVFRSNNAYVGLPVISFAFASAGATPERLDAIHSLAALSLAPCLILYNVLAVFVLTPNALGAYDTDDGEKKPAFRVSPGKILKGIVRNPLIEACVLGSVGLALRQKFQIEAPAFLDATLKSVGSLAGPGALLALGASLTPDRLRIAARPAHIACFLKLVVTPLAGFVLALLFGLPPDARFVALAYLTCPTAVASFVMAQEMKGDTTLASGTVALSTVYSVVALAVLLALSF